MTSEKKIPEWVRLQAQQQGLERALSLFADEVAVAAERGLKSLGEIRGGLSPLSAPAPVFNPARFEADQ
jgi:hypothetical protein